MHKRTKLANTHVRSPRSMLAILVAAVLVALFVGVFAVHSLIPAQGASGSNGLTKQQILQREQQAIATAQANPHKTPKIPGALPITVTQPAATPQAGIFATHQGPFSPLDFQIRNAWQGPVGQSWLVVYAGVKRNPDGSQGAGGLRLYTQSASYIGFFPAPGNAASLIVTAVNGVSMQLQSDAGTTYTFNLETRQYS